MAPCTCSSTAWQRYFPPYSGLRDQLLFSYEFPWLFASADASTRSFRNFPIPELKFRRAGKLNPRELEFLHSRRDDNSLPEQIGQAVNHLPPVFILPELRFDYYILTLNNHFLWKRVIILIPPVRRSTVQSEPHIAVNSLLSYLIPCALLIDRS